MSLPDRGIRETIQDLQDSPQQAEMSIQARSASCYVALMAAARREHGITLENAGRIDTYYFRDEGALVVDLDSHKAATAGGEER